MKRIYMVECFDSRRGGLGLGGNPIGGSLFVANGGVYMDLKNAKRCAKACEKNGLAAAIKSMAILDYDGD